MGVEAPEIVKIKRGKAGEARESTGLSQKDSKIAGSAKATRAAQNGERRRPFRAGKVKAAVGWCCRGRQLHEKDRSPRASM